MPRPPYSPRVVSSISWKSVGDEIVGVRVERGEHALQRRFDQLLVVDGGDVLALDHVEHVPEQFEHVIGLRPRLGVRLGHRADVGHGSGAQTKAETPIRRYLRMGGALTVAAPELWRARRRLEGSVPMIGRARQDGHRPIDLLRQASRAQEREARSAGRTRSARRAALRTSVAQPVRAADDEGQPALAPVAQVRQPGRRSRGRRGAGACSSQAIRRAPSRRGQKSGGLGRPCRACGPRPPRSRRGRARASGPRRWRGRRSPGELAFGRSAEAADAEQRDLQWAAGSMVWAEPTDQIFSML